jgi:hypothetical protein
MHGSTLDSENCPITEFSINPEKSQVENSRNSNHEAVKEQRLEQRLKILKNNFKLQ